MAVLIDTSAVPARERFDFWADSLTEFLHPLDHRRAADRPFAARLSMHRLGSVTAYRVKADASTVVRTPAGIRALDPEQVSLIVILEGRLTGRQGDRATTLGPGDISSFQSSEPYSVQAYTPFELVNYSIPRSLFGLVERRVCEQTATSLPASQGLARIAGPFLAQVLDGLDAGEIEGDSSLGDTVLDLARGLCVARAPGTPRDRPSRGGSRADLLLRVKAFIQANLGDPCLCPEAIARAHFISRRLLYKLFETEGLGVCEWIRIQRLERCRRDLQDPALRDETILSIASRWGLSDATYFSRLFRAAYGCTPREFRARGDGTLPPGLASPAG